MTARCLVLTMLLVLAAATPAAAQFSDVPGVFPGASSTKAAPSPAMTAKPALAGAAQAASAPSAPAGPPAKQLFGAAKVPAALEARAIGSYARGCLAGARPIATDGPAWQAMRLSRNRNWGHPALVALVERLAVEAKARDGWPGLLLGDMSQPRGGPMLTGHASHQLGLDADIWLTPMPDRKLTTKEREEISATSMLAAGELTVDPRIWTPRHLALIRRAASYPEVERIFVHPGIKQALCKAAGGPANRPWLAKVRPMWGHNFHFHVRIACPKGSQGCEPQKAVTGDDGCGKELEDWFALLKAPPKPGGPPKPPMTLEQLPAACKLVLDAPATTEAVAKGN